MCKISDVYRVTSYKNTLFNEGASDDRHLNTLFNEGGNRLLPAVSRLRSRLTASCSRWISDVDV